MFVVSARSPESLLGFASTKMNYAQAGVPAHAFPSKMSANLVKSTLFSSIKAPILAALSTLSSGQTVCAGEIRAFKHSAATLHCYPIKQRPVGLFSHLTHRQYYVRDGGKPCSLMHDSRRSALLSRRSRSQSNADGERMVFEILSDSGFDLG